MDCRLLQIDNISDNELKSFKFKPITFSDGLSIILLDSINKDRIV